MSFSLTDCRQMTRDEVGAIAYSGTTGMTETRYFQATIDNQGTTPLEMANLSGAAVGGSGGASLPAYLSAHPIYTNIVCIKKVAKRMPGSDGKPARLSWLISADYGVITWGATTNGNYISVSVAGVKQTIYTQLTKASTPLPITNSVIADSADSNDLYPEPCETQIYDEKITVTFEAASIDGDTIAALRGCINNGTVSMSIPQSIGTYTRSFAKHSLILDTADYSIRLSRLNPSNLVWSCDLVLLWRNDPNGWDWAPPDKGYRWFDDSGKVTDWKETAQLLDGGGYRLASGDPLVALDGTSGAPGPFQRYTEANIGGFLSSL